MGHIYGVVNQKGGVGKTTTAVNLAAYFARSGARTLLVDIDPQGNATSGIGIDRSTVAHSIYDILIDGYPVAETVLPTAIPELKVVPATIDLAGAEIELMPRMAREGYLKTALAPVLNDFDIIIIDAPPSLGILTLNVLVAANSLIIPIQSEYYALEGISQLIKTIDLVRRQLNPGLDVARVVVTMHDNRIKIANQVVDEVRNYFGSRVSSIQIPRNVRLSEAPSHGLPVALYAPRSTGAAAYSLLAQEILNDGKTRPG